MRVVFFLVFVVSLSCNFKGGLEERETTIEMCYVVWGCECANWAPIDVLKDTNRALPLDQYTCFIEPANVNNQLSNDTIGFSNDRVLFTGRFYENEGYPADFTSSQWDVEKAKVFRYTNYKILKSGYRNYINTLDSL